MRIIDSLSFKTQKCSCYASVTCKVKHPRFRAAQKKVIIPHHMLYWINCSRKFFFKLLKKVYSFSRLVYACLLGLSVTRTLLKNSHKILERNEKRQRHTTTTTTMTTTTNYYYKQFAKHNMSRKNTIRALWWQWTIQHGVSRHRNSSSRNNKLHFEALADPGGTSGAMDVPGCVGSLF